MSRIGVSIKNVSLLQSLVKVVKWRCPTLWDSAGGLALLTYMSLLAAVWQLPPLCVCLLAHLGYISSLGRNYDNVHMYVLDEVDASQAQSLSEKYNAMKAAVSTHTHAHTTAAAACCRLAL